MADDGAEPAEVQRPVGVVRPVAVPVHREPPDVRDARGEAGMIEVQGDPVHLVRDQRLALQEEPTAPVPKIYQSTPSWNADGSGQGTSLTSAVAVVGAARGATCPPAPVTTWADPVKGKRRITVATARRAMAVIPERLVSMAVNPGGRRVELIRRPGPFFQVRTA